MKPVILLISALFLLLPTELIAQTSKTDVTGTWKLNVDLGGDSGTVTMTFVQKDKDLTGTYQGTLGKEAVKGSMDGNKIEFSFNLEGQYEVTYNGSVDGEEMKGTCDYAGYATGTFSGKREAEEKSPE
jgi:hypothetical protein